MSIGLEFMTVIVPKAVLDEKYPGGAAAYAANAPNGTYREDEHLTAVSFMNHYDVNHVLDKLRDHGLTVANESEYVDAAAVDELFGKPLPCPWLTAGKVDGVFQVWLTDTEPGELAVPPAWKRRNDP